MDKLLRVAAHEYRRNVLKRSFLLALLSVPAMVLVIVAVGHRAGIGWLLVLFGSIARGDSRPWSDIDVLIVVDREDWRLSHAISDLAADVSLECDVLLGPRAIGEERWERIRQRGSGLYQCIAAEGVPLTPG